MSVLTKTFLVLIKFVTRINIAHNTINKLYNKVILAAINKNQQQ